MIHLVILALTGSCNLACTYCYASNQAKTFMKKETIDALISRLVEERNESMKAPPLTVQLTGGEPLLAFRQISYLVRRMEEAGLHASFQLQTNATLMTPAIASFIKKHHIAAGVSLDGVPEVNDLTRPEQGGGGSSLKTLRGIRILAEAGVEIGVTCVVSRYNAAHLDALVDLCFYMGNVRKIGFNLLRPQGWGTKEAKAEAMAAVKGISRAILHARKMETLTGRTMIISQMENAGNSRRAISLFHTATPGMITACMWTRKDPYMPARPYRGRSASGWGMYPAVSSQRRQRPLGGSWRRS